MPNARQFRFDLTEDRTHDLQNWKPAFNSFSNIHTKYTIKHRNSLRQALWLSTTRVHTQATLLTCIIAQLSEVKEE